MRVYLLGGSRIDDEALWEREREREEDDSGIRRDGNEERLTEGEKIELARPCPFPD